MKKHLELFAMIMTASALIGCGSSQSPFTEDGNALVETGVPTQYGISLAADPLNPEALNYNDVVVEVTATLSDKNGFPVPNGTVVYFRAETGGQIEPTCTISKEDDEPGACTVQWFSGGIRPGDGTVTVLAYAVGSESYTDLNGNQVYDAGTDIHLTDIPEAFIDYDRSGTRDANEPFVDFNGNSAYDTADGLYNGDDCVGDVTVCGTSSIHVFDDIQITMSGSQATITMAPPAITVATSATTSATLNIVDANGNTLPTNTSISISSTGGTVNPTTFTISDFGQTSFDISVTGGSSATTGSITVTVTTEQEVQSVQNFVLTVT